MAKIGTAYIEIKPDLTGFAAELKAGLAKIKETFKVKAEVDNSAISRSIAQLGDDAKVRKATKKWGTDLGDDLAERAGSEFVGAFQMHTKGFDEKGKRIAGIFADGFAEKMDEAVPRFVDEFSKDIDREFKRQLRQPLDNFRDETNVVMRHAAEDWIKRIRATFSEEKRNIPASESTMREIERQATRRFGAMGSAMARAMFRDIDREAKDSLRHALNEWSKARNVVSLASRLGNEFFTALAAVSNGWSKLLANPFGIALVAAVGTLAVTFASAWIAALGSAFVGLGGIGFAAFLLRDEERVVAAATHLGERFTQIFGAAAKHLAEPIANGLRMVDDALPGLAATWSRIFEKLAVPAQNVFEGLIGAAQNFSKGILKGMPGIEAVLNGLAERLPEVGEAIGDIFEKLGEDPEAARRTMEGFLTTVVNLTNVLGSALATFTKWAAAIQTWSRNMHSAVDVAGKFREMLGAENPSEAWGSVADAWDNMWANFSGATDQALIDQDRLIDKLRATSEAAKKAAEPNLWDTFQHSAKNAFQPLTEGAKSARDKIFEVIDGMRILNGELLDAQEAEDNFHGTVNDLNEALKEREHTLKGNSDAALDNRNAVRDLARGIEETAKANLKAGASAEEVNKKYMEQRKVLKDVLAQFGITGQAAEDYINDILATPEQIATQFVVNGIPGAKAAINGVISPQGGYWITANMKVYIPPGLSEDLKRQLGAMGFAAGDYFNEQLARGVLFDKQRPANASAQLAALMKQYQYGSPAKKGPLSGSGDVFYSGIEFSKRLAAGMLNGETYVADASSTLAGTMRVNPGYAGSTTYDSMGTTLTAYVMLDGHMLDKAVDELIVSHDEDTARALLAGRTAG